ncbi:WD repeat-containing protein 4 [Aspergillus wentii]|nr:WD repeat-containing protein 4 [Aspergillus wentii]
MSFQHPFHCVRFIKRQQSGAQNLLVATAGPKIYSFAAESGQRLAVWPQDVEPSKEDSSKDIGTEASPEDQTPPEKKIKVTPSTDQTAGEDPKSTSQESKKPKTPAWSSIPLLIASSDGKHVVALTSEDKCLRVFAVGEDGSLQQLSERVMPKRPSAIVFACNDSTILSGDKFGDVYSLPLIPSETPATKTPNPAKTYQPKATTLTVHTKRNLAALEQQILHSNQNASTVAEKAGPDFECDLILGHVSLLTDVAYVSLSLETGAKRTYVLTADRDEHIRVSRGPPQAHVIENYCFGHNSFISKLCIPQWEPELLISGGGDNFLLVWKWSEGQILQKVPLVEETSQTEVIVRGIWAVPFAESTKSESLKVILVALEWSSQLLSYTLQSDGTLKPQGSIQVSGNALDVTGVERNGTIMVSVDGVREAGSTQNWRASPASSQALIESYRAKLSSEGLEWEPTNDPATSRINSEGTSELTAAAEDKKRNELNESLYALGNLRKKAGAEDA